MARSVPALQRVHRSFEEQKTMFVSRFSRAEHVDTLVSWIEAQNQCLQKFALLSSQGLPPAILTSLETKLRFALAFWLFPPAPKIFSGPTFRAALPKKKCCLCGKAVLRAYAVLKIVISADGCCCSWCFQKKFDSALKLRMTKTLAPRLAVVASI